MKLYSMPKTKLGNWALGLIVAMPILFFAGSLCANLLYASVPSGNTISEDLATRPILAITMLLGMISGISAFIIGLVAIIKKEERTLLVYGATAAGALLLLFLLGEFLFSR